MKNRILKCIILICIIQLSYTPLSSKIYKRIKADGTIEFYNKNESHYSSENTQNKAKLISKYDELIEKNAKENGIDPFLIKCIIKIESNFNPDAVSIAGAMGLMQLMQDTAKYYNMQDPLDPEENIKIGTKHFSYLLKYFNNDVPLALAAYHAGIGRVKKRMSIPPIKATIEYVNMVMSLYEGKSDYSVKVKRLYQRLEKDGTLIIYSK